MGSPNLHYYALQRYYGEKEGLTEEQVIQKLAYQDALLDLDSIDSKVIELYTQKRMRFYKKEFSRISNVTVLDPDPDSRWKHKFSSFCYQSQIHEIIKKYQHER